MKQIYIVFSLLFVLFVSSCNDERDGQLGDGGKLLAQVTLSDSPQIITKAAYGNDWNPAGECTIQIIEVKSQQVLHTYNKVADLPAELSLEAGDYLLMVKAGMEAVSTFEKGYYDEEKAFSITRTANTEVELACKMKNTLATVKFTNELMNVLDDFSVSVIGEDIEKALKWQENNNGQTGYFLFSDAKDLTWSFTAEMQGKSISLANIVEDAKPNTNYVLTFSYDESQVNGPAGGVIFDLEVLEPRADEDEVNLYGLLISGDNFNINQPYQIKQGEEQSASVAISTSAELASVEVTVENLVKDLLGLPATTFDFVNMSEEDMAIYAAAGIVFERTIATKSEVVFNSYQLTVVGSKIQNLPLGSYSFKIEVTDTEGESANSNMIIQVVEGDVELFVATAELITGDVWAVKSILRGTLLKSTSENITFDYRVKDASEWITVPATLESDNITLKATVSGLADNTVYEYRVKAGEQEGDIKTFTTELARQLPNSGFENWQEPYFKSIFDFRNYYLIYGENEDKFWDSGNKGATTLSSDQNVTIPDETIFHEGQKSAKLASDYIAIKFAAGNLFAGNYVKTVGTSGAQLDFGRPFTSRPSRMTGWYKYQGGAINRAQKTPPQNLIDEGAATGNPDKGIVYVALGDWEQPVRIDNSNSSVANWSLFDKDDPHVIAYGEFVQSETTEGDDMLPFNITLDYKDLTRVPTYIIVVCSASKYGDYFIGCDSSVLWVDDFELIYE